MRNVEKRAGRRKAAPKQFPKFGVAYTHVVTRNLNVRATGREKSNLTDKNAAEKIVEVFVPKGFLLGSLLIKQAVANKVNSTQCISVALPSSSY